MLYAIPYPYPNLRKSMLVKWTPGVSRNISQWIEVPGYLTISQFTEDIQNHQRRLRKLWDIMTSSNGNIFRVSGHLCGEFPHKGQWRRALIFSLICAWINGWINNHEADDSRRHSANYDVTVIKPLYLWNRHYVHADGLAPSTITNCAPNPALERIPNE